MTTVTFNIQTLEGETFSVSLPLELVEKVHHQNAPLRDYYDQYGLDHLKEAICQERGVDPVCQTILGQRELNINSRLLDYSDLLLTLLVTSSITVKFTNIPYQPFYFKIEKCMSVDPWQERTAWLNNGGQPPPNNCDTNKDLNNKHECELICYLSLGENWCLSEIQVLGRSRDYFKVLFKSLPPQHLKGVYMGLVAHWHNKLYEVTATDPEYVWIRYQSEYMVCDIS